MSAASEKTDTTRPVSYSGQAEAVALYPLAALAGQDRLKTALLLLAVDPRLGGVLLVGQKGTAKSTAVRALAELLPPIEAVPGCPYHCQPDDQDSLCPDCRDRLNGRPSLPREAIPTPFLTLPLGATEDRLIGGLDMETAVSSGRRSLSVGLLGQANRGFLYVDEVNLLEPYLGHLLLDAAESGRVRVEREGLSLWHPARLSLIGTMNPEEGPLGPQLADRFALTVNVSAETDPESRAEIIRRRLAFEADPAGFRRRWAGASRELADRIIAARFRLPGLTLTSPARTLVSRLVRENRVHGHRGDLALARAALALAAWRNLPQADEALVLEVSEPALNNRRTAGKKLLVSPEAAAKPETPPSQHHETPYQPSGQPEYVYMATAESETGQPLAERVFNPNEVFELITPDHRRDHGPRGRSGRRSARRTNTGRGRYFRSSPERLGRPVALDATFRAAAPHQIKRRPQGNNNFIVRSRDLHEKVFRQKTGRFVLFVVDASGSVGSLDRMSEAKSAVLALLGEAYRKRDRVALVAFHGVKASVLLPPTNSVEMASRLLQDLPTGGKTPLAAALVAAHQIVRTELARAPDLTPLVVLMTDGRPNLPLDPDTDPWKEALNLADHLGRDPRLRFLLVDTDNGYYNDYKLTHDLAEKLRAPKLTLEDLRRGDLNAWLEKLV